MSRSTYVLCAHAATGGAPWGTWRRCPPGWRDRCRGGWQRGWRREAAAAAPPRGCPWSARTAGSGGRRCGAPGGPCPPAPPAAETQAPASPERCSHRRAPLRPAAQSSGYCSVRRGTQTSSSQTSRGTLHRSGPGSAQVQATCILCVPSGTVAVLLLTWWAAPCSRGTRLDRSAPYSYRINAVTGAIYPGRVVT